MQDRTFIIDSDYLDGVKEHLYGYMITDDGDIYIDEVPDKIYDSGLFCIVKRRSNNIIVKQDFCASFGLYLYQSNNHFVVSNSFFRMVEYIDDKLSINYRALDIIFYADDCPIIYKETPIKEIVKLTSDEYISINVVEKSISVLQKKYVYFEKQPDR